MANAVENGTTERELASVQLGGPQLAKARDIASTMGVNVATVTRWAIDHFDLSLFLVKRQAELTVHSEQQADEVAA